MRVYLAATAADLSAPELLPERVHAVTPAVRAELPEEDEEMLELVAFLAAADESVVLVGARGDRPRRVVISADLDARALAPSEDPENIATAMVPAGPVAWDAVAAIHVDDADAEARVSAAAGGDGAAADEVAEIDLAWYDVSEVAELRSLLGE